MRGIVVPEKTEDFTADPVELFFDLAFVFAFSQLVHLLIVHPDWEHVGKATLIFLLLWAVWSQFSWSANAVPGNQRSVRVGFLVATAASVPMAAAVETAFDDSGLLFAVPLAVIFLMANGVLVSSTERGTAARATTIRYSIPNTIAMITLVAGGIVDGTARYVVWIAAFLVVLWATIKAGQGEWTIRPGHFAERHGLIIIIALGEVIVALGNAVVDPLSEEGGGFAGETVAALAATGIAAGLLWWSYFDRVQPALEHHAEELDSRPRGRFARDGYTYAHMPIVAGVILIAVGIEEAALHPGDPLPLAYRMMLLAGILCFFGGINIGVWRAFRAVARERLIAMAVITGVLALAGSVEAVWLIVVIDVVVIAVLVAEHLRIEVRPSDPKIHHAH
ncbi:MAG: low temperature requirement protein A [Ilumatobacter sp.]|uniref:low temperature requirement protein A n=1 Tax=Ilumatobacter sp. TaxID=1967498 RepID=UPI003298B210